MAANLEDFPRMLKKPGGERMKVANADELKRGLADGWKVHLDPDPVDSADPADHAPKPLTDVPPAKGAKVEKASEPEVESVLDGSVVALKDAIAHMTDVRELQNLRLQETKSKNRQGALDALDARVLELTK